MSDLISRKEAMDAIMSTEPFIVEINGEQYVGQKTSDVMDVLQALPSAEPERKKGKWLHKPNEYDDDTYECSRCGEPWTLIDGTPEENNMNFCPNCGADMRGER